MCSHCFLTYEILRISLHLRKFVQSIPCWQIRVITKLPNSEQSYKGKVKTHNYIK